MKTRNFFLLLLLLCSVAAYFFLLLSNPILKSMFNFSPQLVFLISRKGEQIHSVMILILIHVCIYLSLGNLKTKNMVYCSFQMKQIYNNLFQISKFKTNNLLLNFNTSRSPLYKHLIFNNLIIIFKKIMGLLLLLTTVWLISIFVELNSNTNKNSKISDNSLSYLFYVLLIFKFTLPRNEPILLTL